MRAIWSIRSARAAAAEDLQSRRLIAQHMDLDVPAEIVDALRQWLEHVDCRSSGLDEIEADAANTEVVEPLQFGVGDGRIDHRDAAGSRAELGHRIESAGIILSLPPNRDVRGRQSATTASRRLRPSAVR